jgi:hypothetical protein
VLVVINRFSRYVWTFLYWGLPSARDILSNLDGINSVQGIFPCKVISNHGPQFNSLQRYHGLHIRGSKPAIAAPYHPESDGITIRAIQSLQPKTRCIFAQSKLPWLEAVSLATNAHNRCVSAATGSSPFKVRNGTQDQTRFESSLRIGSRANMNREVQEHLRSYCKQMSKRLARKGSIRQYKVGDLVWYDWWNDFLNRLGKFDARNAGLSP